MNNFLESRATSHGHARDKSGWTSGCESYLCMVVYIPLMPKTDVSIQVPPTLLHSPGKEEA